jgi:hypothetical protein
MLGDPLSKPSPHSGRPSAVDLDVDDTTATGVPPSLEEQDEPTVVQPGGLTSLPTLRGAPGEHQRIDTVDSGEATVLGPPPALARGPALVTEENTAIQLPRALKRASAPRPKVRPPPPPPASAPSPRPTFRRRTTQMMKAVHPAFPLILTVLVAVFVLQLVVGYLRWLNADDSPAAQSQELVPGPIQQFLQGGGR